LIVPDSQGEIRGPARRESVGEAGSPTVVGEGPAGPRYVVSVRIDPESRFSAARALQVYLELQRSTRVLEVTPSLAEIETDESTNTLSAMVITNEAPSLLELRLARISDVAEARVEAVRDAAGAVSDDPAVTGQPEREPKAPAAAMPSNGHPPTAAEWSAPVAGAAKPTALDRSPHLEGSVRISVGIVDDLMSLVSELVLGRTRLQTVRAALHARYQDDGDIAALEDVVGHLDAVTTDLQAAVMKVRMVPVETVFNKFPRLVRDLAAQMGKQVGFTMSDHKTGLDRSVIEHLSDPLVHLLRNCIDHGIEPPEERAAAGKPVLGAITLSAASLENHIVIEVRDDGRGIDRRRVMEAAVRKGLISPEAAERLTGREALELVFTAGLSTAEEITDISGRGVGMDIVKVAIERMGGRIAIDSAPGRGTTFVVTLPLTLAIMQALLVSVGGAVYALPLHMVTEILSVSDDQIQTLQGTEATLLRGTILPLIRLREWFRCPSADHPAGRRHIVAVRVEGRLFGLVVDHFLGEQEIVMKPLGSYMGLIPGLAGATILGDGRIALLVDVVALKADAPCMPRTNRTTMLCGA
ncbi:MAG: chemotaxis protein CheA, partial [Chloroflexota bacterium]